MNEDRKEQIRKDNELIEAIIANASNDLQDVFVNLKKLAYLKRELTEDITINTCDWLRAIVLTKNSLGNKFLKELGIDVTLPESESKIETLSNDYISYIFEYESTCSELIDYALNELNYSRYYGRDITKMDSELMILSILSKKYFYSFSELYKYGITYASAKKFYNDKYGIDNKIYLPMSTRALTAINWEQYIYDLSETPSFVKYVHTKYIYKFISPDIEAIKSILTNGKIKYSLASQLNDKLELKVKIDKIVDFHELLKQKGLYDYNRYIDEAAINGYDSLPPISKEVLTLDMFKNPVSDFANNHSELIANILNMLMDKFSDKIPFNGMLQQDYYDNFAVLSLTTNCFSSSMWAHYAKNHSGVVLMFDLTHQYFYDEKPDSQLSEVMYLDMLYKIKNLMDKIPLYNFVENTLFFQKTKDWEYESEWRMVKKANELEKIMFDNGNYIYLDNIPIEAIVGIIFGIDVEPNFKKECINMTQSNEETKNILLFDIAIDDNLNYKLEPCKIE